MDNCLTRKQQAFVLEYLKDRNATKSAQRAGYSPRRASEIGYQLLQKTTIQNSIDILQNDIEKQLRMRFVQDAIMARNVLYDVMVSPTSSNRDKIIAAKNLLDRAGYKARNKTEKSGYGEGNSIEIRFVEP